MIESGCQLAEFIPHLSVNHRIRYMSSRPEPTLGALMSAAGGRPTCKPARGVDSAPSPSIFTFGI